MYLNSIIAWQIPFQNLQLEKYQEYLIDLTEIELKSALDITTEEKEETLIDYGYIATKEHIIKRYINREVQNDHMSWEIPV